MITASTELPTDLAPLVPRRSRGRAVALALAATLALAAAWASPALLRPALVGSSGGGWSVELAGSSTVLVVSQLHPDAWPFVAIEGVEALPGATPVAAWVFRETSYAPGEPVASEPHGYLEAAYVGLDLPPGGNLPARVPLDPASAGELMIAIAWRIDDCARFNETSGEDQSPRAILRSAVGTQSRATLGTSAQPMMFGTQEICGS